MIQRIQSVYLLLAAIVMGVFMFMPTVNFTANGAQHVLGAITGVNGIDTPNYVLLVSEILFIVCTIFTIFQFKNLKRQKLLCKINAALAGAALGSTLASWLTYKSGGATISLWIILLVVATIFLALALHGIRKDIKLLAEADRLR